MKIIFIFLTLFLFGTTATTKTSELIITEEIPVEYFYNNSKPILKKKIFKNNFQKSFQFYQQFNQISNKNTTLFNKIDNLNFLFNSYFLYASDIDVYGKDDYFASFNEMIERGFKGDCEDFSLAKILLAKEFKIPKENVFLGITIEHHHMFPIFFDGKDYIVSESSGKLIKLGYYINKYPDLKIYSYSEIFNSDDEILSSKKAKLKSIFYII